MRALWLVAALVLGSLTSALAFTACDGDDTTPLCYPKEKDPCYCRTGDPGERICKDDGLSYGACVCLPDAGVDAPGPDSGQ